MVYILETLISSVSSCLLNEIKYLPLDTVAGVAVLKCPISNKRRISFVSAIRSLLANVSTLLSSITVFKLSIQLERFCLKMIA